MKTVLSVVFTTLYVIALAVAQLGQESGSEMTPDCIVMPEVIEACENGGGRFDWKTCSCVGGSEGGIVVAES